MAKTVAETAMTTKNARAELAQGIHWRSLDTDVHMGYRKAKRGGTWVVRWYKGDGKYQQEPIGAADDFQTPDGDTVLTFDQAKKRARAVVDQRRAEAKASIDGAPVTIKSAVENYIIDRDDREKARKGRTVRSDANRRLTRYVLSNETLATTPLHTVTAKQLTDWTKRLSGLKGTTVKRLINDFRAALNKAAEDHHDRMPASLTADIKRGFKVKSEQHDDEADIPRTNQIMTDADVRRIIETAYEIGEDFGRIIVVMAATGARFSQVVRLRVSDVQVSEKRVMVPASRKGRRDSGKTRHIAFPVGQDVIDALRPALAGRHSAEPLLERWRHVQKPGSIEWHRDTRGAWQSSSEITRPWRDLVTRVGLPGDIVPYSLRHTSIVRGLRSSLPVRLVAGLHDTSSTMIERHYAAYIVDAMNELAANAAVPLVTTSKVVSIAS